VHRKVTIAAAIIIVIAAAAAMVIVIASSSPNFRLLGIRSITGAPLSDIKQQELNIGGPMPIVNSSSGSGNVYRQANVTVNTIKLIAYVAESDEQRTKGLSVKNALLENEAMIFIFKTEGQHAFWMKNMKFPIDIIWLNNDKSVVHIEHNLQPYILDIFCQIYNPNTNSLYVLETAAGFAHRHGIAEGTPVRFQFNPS
jgi:uncharacterized membrane protein (UPF0127 family)